MDYYEELGIAPTATEEEIRRAHRRLTKLVHPDQQTDEGLKQLAETQMRRLNSMVEILCDPERRRLYDEQVRNGGFGLNLRAQPRGRTLRSLPFWVASTVGAVALTLGAVWFWADNWGSSFGNRTPTYIPSEATAEAPAKPATVPSATLPEKPAGGQPERPGAASANPAPALGSRTIAAVPTPGRAEKRPAPLPDNRGSEASTEARARAGAVPQRAATARKKLNLVNTDISAQARPVDMDVPPPPNVPTEAPSHVDMAAIPEASVPAVPTKFPAPAVHAKVKNAARQNALEGEWVYAPTAPEKRKAGFYPPEFIDLKLFSVDGGLHGQYRARYHVTDRPIPPEVDFTLAPDTGSNKFVWKSSNGSKGTLKISSIDGSSIRIEWRTTVFSNSPELTAGTATLVRRTQ